MVAEFAERMNMMNITLKPVGIHKETFVKQDKYCSTRRYCINLTFLWPVSDSNTLVN
jgi:hypothetical protein